jgi:ribulose-phosphate 3-epimerase
MQTSARELLQQSPSLSVGILTADLLRLGEELEVLDATGVTIAHVDVMDGVFCPQTTVGPPIVAALPDRFVKDVHLMVEDPLEKAHAYVEAGAGILTFHIESTRHPHRLLQRLAGSGVVRGVALNPGTPVATVEPLLDELELLLVLAVNPGWGGQSFIPSTERRLAEVRALVEDREIVVAVDGGITRANVEWVASLGVDMIVSGTAIYDGRAAADNARAMLDTLALEGGRSEVSGRTSGPS